MIVFKILGWIFKLPIILIGIIVQFTSWSMASIVDAAIEGWKNGKNGKDIF